MDYYNNQTYYDILGVTKNASLENIRAARDRLKYGSPDDRVPFSMWEKIDNAYDVLSDSEKRKEYDKALENNQTNIDYPNDFVSQTVQPIEPEVSEPVIEEPKEDEVLSEIEQPKENIPNELPYNKQEIEEPKKDDVLEHIEQPKENDYEEPKEVLDHGTDEKANEDILENPVSDINDKTEPIPVKNSPTNNLKNDIFNELRFKPVEDSKFKDADSVIAGKNAKRIGKFATVGALTFLLFNIPGVTLLAAGYLINKKVRKKVKKAKLTKESYTGIITEVQTTESRLIEESNQKLMSSIDKLSEKNYSDVNTRKLRLKYGNEVQLLEKMIELRENTKKEKGQLTSRELRIQALKGQLRKAKRNLKYVNESVKHNELIDSIGEENLDSYSKNIKNLTLSNKYLEMKYALQKIKAQGGLVNSVKNNIRDKFAISEDVKEIQEEQQSRYR